LEDELKKNGRALQQWARLGRLCANRRVADHGTKSASSAEAAKALLKLFAEENLRSITTRCENGSVQNGGKLRCKSMKKQPFENVVKMRVLDVQLRTVMFRAKQKFLYFPLLW